MSYFDSALTPEEEWQFQRWAQSVGRAGDTQDYDLRGAWKANVKAAANGHLPDTYKKPNHPTFSQESQYSTPDQTGGEWAQAPDGKWSFFASPWNMNTQGAKNLWSYFNEREPDATPVLPIDFRLLPRKAK